MSHFEQKLTDIINGHSMENGSNTPDFLLAEYMVGCLEIFNRTIAKRAEWHGEDPAINSTKPSERLSNQLSSKMEPTGE